MGEIWITLGIVVGIVIVIGLIWTFVGFLINLNRLINHRAKVKTETKEIWKYVGVWIVMALIVGIVAVIGIFFDKVWQHVNQEPAVIKAESIIFKGKEITVGIPMTGGVITVEGPGKSWIESGDERWTISE